MAESLDDFRYGALTSFPGHLLIALARDLARPVHVRRRHQVRVHPVHRVLDHPAHRDRLHRQPYEFARSRDQPPDH